jgi:hypothetical protein
LMHPIKLLGDVGHLESHFGPFRDGVGVVARQVSRFAPNVPYAHKLFWTHSMVLLGYEAQLEACFGPFGDSANLDARKVHGLCQAYHRLRNHFG